MGSWDPPWINYGQISFHMTEKLDIKPMSSNLTQHQTRTHQTKSPPAQLECPKKKDSMSAFSSNLNYNISPIQPLWFLTWLHFPCFEDAQLLNLAFGSSNSSLMARHYLTTGTSHKKWRPNEMKPQNPPSFSYPFSVGGQKAAQAWACIGLFMCKSAG